MYSLFTLDYLYLERINTRRRVVKENEIEAYEVYIHRRATLLYVASKLADNIPSGCSYKQSELNTHYYRYGDGVCV